MSGNDHNKLEKSDSVLRELAGAQIKLSTLLDFPDFARRFVEILNSNCARAPRLKMFK